MPQSGRALIDLAPYTDPGRVRFLAPGLGKASALRELAQATAAHPAVGDLHGFIAAILERERVSATGIGSLIPVDSISNASKRSSRQSPVTGSR